MAQTVRQRFTVLYAVVFGASAVGLLALTNAFGSISVTSPAPRTAVPAEVRIAQMEAELVESAARQSEQLLTGSLLALAVALVVAVVVGRALAGRVLRPLRTITAATRRISADNLHERLALDGPADEVTDLADTVDDLLARLEAAFAAQRRFVANASHELRTPLATIRAAVDVAAAKAEPAAQAVALADRVRTEVDKVDHLLEGLLALARARHGDLGDPEAVSLHEVMTEALAAHADRIAERGLVVESDLAAAWTLGSPVLLARLADNLVDNAVTHNHDEGWVRVATIPGATARLVVETGGAVLDPAQVARLDRPFTRLAADRTGSDGGSGLGLSIVAAVVEAHGGRLDLRARPEGGLRVGVALPAAPEPGSA
ncbi:sensor histidine kinase [Pseudonocardia lacus]|uniref:sensor histidine kinase n=1 Tax=Pseudonocardia lacus TaxID=2835865 RepID=UPI001BDDA032|nr:HAMP domain-containing sensor histidine kinase [Pseudonocardia lacus]